MGKFKTFVTIAALLFTTGVTYAQDNTMGKLEIKDMRKTTLPATDPAHHKNYDVEVYRSTLMTDGYAVRFYSLQNNTVYGFEAFYGSDGNDYTNAHYHWVDNNTVSILLYGATKKTQFKVTGKVDAAGHTTTSLSVN